MSDDITKEQAFHNMRNRLIRIIDEEFNIKEDDIAKWDALVETYPLPPVNKTYDSFIHPEASSND